MESKLLKKIISVELMSCLILTNLPVYADTYENDVFGKVIEKIDFENYSEGEEITEGQIFCSGKIRFEGQNADNTVTIKTDPITGSKALKMEKNPQDTANFRTVYELDESEKEWIYKISYDLRLASATGAYKALGAVQGKKSAIFTLLLYQDGGMFETNFSKYVDHYKNKIGNASAHFEYILDFKNKTADLSVCKDGETVMKCSKNGISAEEIYRIVWGIDSPIGNENYRGWEYNASSIQNAVTYIDNIVIERAEFIPSSSSPESGDENVDDTKIIEINFNTEPAEDIGNYIEVYQDKEKLDTGFDVLIKGQTLQISFKEGMQFGSDYRILLKAGAGAKKDGYTALSDDYDIEFKTLSILPEIIGVSDGESYNKSVSVTITSKPGTVVESMISKDGGEYIEYKSGTELTQEGKYELQITAEKNGKKEVKNISFNIVGEKAPVAQDLTIEKEGLTLTAKYRFIDYNGDKEKDSLIEWYIGDSENGEFLKHSEGKTFTVTEETEGKYVKFYVTPIADKEPYEGERKESGVFVLPARPYIASEIKFDGQFKLNEKISLKYEYADKNNDEENGTVIEWYRTNEDRSKKEKIDNDGQREYILTADDSDCYIMVEVIPKNSGDFGEGIKYESKPIVSFCKPEVRDAKILNAEQGKNASVSYVFYDINNDREGQTSVEWFLNGVSLGTGLGISIDNNASGTLVAKITPVSTEYPNNGDTVEVSADIKKRSSSDRGSSSTGSGGSRGGAAVNNPVGFTKNDEVKEPDKIAPDKDLGLNDISAHWAKESIEKLYDKKIITGDNGKFYPDKNITRAEFAMLISKLLELDTKYTDLFLDVDGSEWYADAVCSVKNAGIMNGDGINFKPQSFITREELCVACANILKVKNIDVTKSATAFKDKSDISEWAWDSVDVCVGMNMINGMGEEMMMPKANATKAQAAKLAEKLLAVLEGTK